MAIITAKQVADLKSTGHVVAAYPRKGIVWVDLPATGHVVAAYPRKGIVWVDLPAGVQALAAAKA